MLTIVSIMLCGILLGRLLRGRNTAAVSRVITVLIWALLFLLGIEVGSNPKIIGGLQTLGFEALVLTIGGSTGSVLAAWALWTKVSNKESKGGKA